MMMFYNTEVLSAESSQDVDHFNHFEENRNHRLNIAPSKIIKHVVNLLIKVVEQYLPVSRENVFESCYVMFISLQKIAKL
jgi:hypothetical protein